jgi:SPP1 family predicted phage head-tail adaptor
MRQGLIDESKKIRAGKLTKRLVIQTKTTNETKNGSFKENWTELDTVWARISRINQTENILGKSVNNIAIAIILIRYRSDIDTNCRGYWNNSYYNFTEIINVNNEDRKLLITAEVRSNEQN